MMLDRDLVTRKLVLVLADLDRLESVGGSAVDAFVADAYQQAVAERLLERMIGRMIDVNYHLITEAGEPPPPDYHASFDRLAPLGVLDAESARRIARAAGLRNRLVHEYEEIDPRKLYEAIQLARDDIAEYAAAVRRHLGSERNEAPRRPEMPPRQTAWRGWANEFAQPHSLR